MKRDLQVFKILGIVFTVISAISLVALIILGTYVAKFNANSVEVEGVIAGFRDSSDGEHSYPIVDYVYEGMMYEVDLNYTDSSMYEGQSIMLKINRDNPTDVRAKQDRLYFIIPIIFFIVYGAIGIPLLVFTIRKKKDRQFLLENGRVLHVPISSIEPTNVEINDTPTYRAVCLYQDPLSGEEIKFKSEGFLKSAMQFNIGDNLDIYVNPDNYKKYYVDVDKNRE